MKKLKVLQVNKFYHPVTGGVERVVQQLSEGLCEDSDVQVLTCTPKGPGERTVVNGVPVRRSGSLGVAFSMPVSLPFLFDFSRMSKEQDIIHLHLPFPLADLALLLSGYRGKVVLWWHSDIVKQKKLLVLYGPLLHWMLRRADAIIVATQGHIDGSDFLPEYQSKCHVIAFGVEPSIMEKSTRYLQAAPVKRTDTLAFLFIGRLVYYKGCDILLRAFAAANLPNSSLTLVGSGPLLETLTQLAATLNISHQVTFLQGLDDAALADQIAACDVFVLPSVAKSEAFGLVQIEAMAYQKPVINTNLPSGVPHVSLDSITGLTVEPSDVEALSKAMRWMAEHPTERMTMGIAGRKRVEEQFTLPKMLEKTFAIYQQLCGQ